VCMECVVYVSGVTGCVWNVRCEWRCVCVGVCVFKEMKREALQLPDLEERGKKGCEVI